MIYSVDHLYHTTDDFMCDRLMYSSSSLQKDNMFLWRPGIKW